MNNQVNAQAGVNRFYAKIYAILALGLGVSAATAYLTINVFPQQIMQFVSRFPLGVMGLWLVEIALVLLLGIKGQKNPSLATAGFVAYSVVNGIVLAFTLGYYNVGDITTAFIASAATFLGMAAVGMFTKRDLSALGRVMYGALMGIIVAMLLNIFVLHSGPVDMFIAILMVIVFAGITAYDNQRIQAIYLQSGGQAGTGTAVFLALQLYLDFINLFLAFLRIFGKNN